MHSIELQRKNGDRGLCDMFYACSTYNEQGTHGCDPNIVREQPIIDFIVPKLIEVLAAPINASRLEQAVCRQIKTAGVPGRTRFSSVTSPRNARCVLSKLATTKQTEIDLAVSRLKRVPDDLYPLAIEELANAAEAA